LLYGENIDVVLLKRPLKWEGNCRGIGPLAFYVLASPLGAGLWSLNGSLGCRKNEI
jgi:hypothetical protein